MITELCSKRLWLRKMEVSDSKSLFAIWSDPDVTKFMNIDPFTDENQVIDMITLFNQLFQENKAVRYSIIETESNQLIGSCGYNVIDFENEKAEIGYEIGKSFWGKGYAPEAIALLLEYAFHHLHFNRVEAKVEPENKNSIKVLEKLGFTFEGTLQKSEKAKGRFIDVNMYSKLRTD